MGRNHPGGNEQQRGREMRQICGRKRPAEGGSGSGPGRRPRRTFTTARWQRPTKPGEWWYRNGKEPVVEGVDFVFDTQDGPGEDFIFFGYSNDEGSKEKVVSDDGEMVPDSLEPEVDAVVVASQQKERAAFVAIDQDEGGGDLARDHANEQKKRAGVLAGDQEEGGGLASYRADEQKERNGFLAEQDNMAFGGREDIGGYSQADDELGWVDVGSPVEEEFGPEYVVNEDMETQEQWVTDMLIKISPCYAKAVYRKRK